MEQALRLGVGERRDHVTTITALVMNVKRYGSVFIGVEGWVATSSGDGPLGLDSSTLVLGAFSLSK